MTDTLMGVSPPPEPPGTGDAQDRELSPAELAAVQDLVRPARQAAIPLTASVAHEVDYRVLRTTVTV